MPPERAALLDATPPSEYPPFSILSVLMVLSPQPRRFCRSQSGIAGCADVLSAAPFPWTHRCAPTSPLAYALPDADPLAHALPDDTPRPARYGGNQLSWRHPAA